MGLRAWLLSRLRHRLAAGVPPAPVTPPEEHAAARQRSDRIRRETDRIQQLIDDYRRMGRIV